MRKSSQFFCFIIIVLIQVQVIAQNEVITKNSILKRYKNEVFTNIDSLVNIEYGEAVNLKGENEKLLLNVFMPTAIDTVKARPLVIFIHGGGFRNNNKSSSISNKLGVVLGKKGYVVASIDYRLGIEKTNSIKDYHEAMYRAQQDARAAIRFFRKNASTYGVDTDQIFLAGSSAGSMTALAVAYMNENEVPSDIDQTKWGSLEGNSGNEGYSSKVQGVLNNWGSMIDYKWIQKGDVPLFNVAGTLDKTVPYDSSYSYNSFKYGPYILYQQCLRLGIPTGWRPFVGAGHTLDNNKMKQDSAVKEMEAWLYTQLKIVKNKNEEPITRWENDFKKFDTLNIVEKHTDSAVLFFGSSYIRYWTNIRTDLEYGDIIHRGFGGSNLRDVAYYVHRLVDPHQPKAIFFYVGNDITASEKDKSPIQVLELFKYVVQEIRVKYPQIPITWLQISPSEKRWSVWDNVQEANALIEQYCATQQNLYMIHFQDHFLGADGLPITKYYREDKLHYNEEGYRIWGAAIKDKVKEIIYK